MLDEASLLSPSVWKRMSKHARQKVAWVNQTASGDRPTAVGYSATADSATTVSNPPTAGLHVTDDAVFVSSLPEAAEWMMGNPSPCTITTKQQFWTTCEVFISSPSPSSWDQHNLCPSRVIMQLCDLVLSQSNLALLYTGGTPLHTGMYTHEHRTNTESLRVAFRGGSIMAAVLFF